MITIAEMRKSLAEYREATKNMKPYEKWEYRYQQMTDQKKPNRMKAYRANMQKLGLTQTYVWVHPQDRNAIQTYAQTLCEKRGIPREK